MTRICVFFTGSLLLGGVLIGCGDRQAPLWGEGAALISSDVTDTSAVVAWPEASDNQGVVAYRVSQDGVQVLLAAPDPEHHHAVAELAEFTGYTFVVTALDEAGNESGPLSLELWTTDVTPPVCDPGCKLVAQPPRPAEGDTQVELTWCASTDNDRVDRIVVLRGLEEITTLPGDAVRTVVEGEDLDGLYVIDACDPSNNCRRLASLQVGQGMLGKLLDRQIAMESSILGGRGFGVDVAWGGRELGASRVEGSLDHLIGNLASVDDFDDLGGHGGVGTGELGSTGGGSISDLGGMGTIGRGSAYRSTYRPAEASLASGGEPALRGHLERRMSRVRNCYTSALSDVRSDHEGLTGTLSVSLQADAEGSITVGGVSGVGSDSLHRCVTSALRGRLGEAPASPVSGSFTIHLDPGGPE